MIPIFRSFFHEKKMNDSEIGNSIINLSSRDPYIREIYFKIRLSDIQ